MEIITLNGSEGHAKTDDFPDLHGSTWTHLCLTVMRIHEMMERAYNRAVNGGISGSGYVRCDRGERTEQAYRINSLRTSAYFTLY